MQYQTLITPQELRPHLGDPNWAVFDCRFTLGDPERGRKDYLIAHIPGAVYVHLEQEMCGPVVRGRTGRHPLLPLKDAVRLFSRLGIDENVQVVAYDDWSPISGAVAARLWWMLRWLGHEQVAVLDGGWRAWIEARMPTAGGVEGRSRRKFTPRLHLEYYASMADVKTALLDPTWKVFDSRTADRFRGENETIDPVAGHIPTAINAPYVENGTPEGTFRSPEELRQRFATLLGETPPQKAIFYCGSGVTAALNLLALKYAGLGDARLYVGSWSEWITDPENPVAR
ncbi:MAG: sulfurtransferase [Anaerolineales bacterium]|nr:sulfurtransferase [Anaerolineales bacterium]MCS7247323.1 sulfurtransferase [Anaerolineales bacterium]MDW8161134.1 sulfurtransferase [Anaerolineales bacterium]MDW8446453.1 sulfurtransferase [Anaerolineales bacterium]